MYVCSGVGVSSCTSHAIAPVAKTNTANNAISGQRGGNASCIQHNRARFSPATLRIAVSFPFTNGGLPAKKGRDVRIGHGS